MNQTYPVDMTAIIVHHDDRPLLAKQLRAYVRDDPERFQRIDWRVIHNGPDPLKPIDILGDDPLLNDCVHIHERENRGYGCALNAGLSLTDAPFALLLNSDLEPMTGTLEKLTKIVGEMKDEAPMGTSDRGVAIRGFRLLDPGGKVQGSVGPFPTLTRFLFGQLWPRSTRKYRSPSSTTVSPVDWATGACWLIDRRCWLELGGLDEQFFMYYEDVDFCKRAWDHGYRVVYDPRVSMTHYHPYHARDLTFRMVYSARHGLLTYFAKHRPRYEHAIVQEIAAIECYLRKRSRKAGDREGWSVVESMVRSYPVGKVLEIDPKMVPE